MIIIICPLGKGQQQRTARFASFTGQSNYYVDNQIGGKINQGLDLKIAHDL
jgi:hypothetical protein